MPRSDADVLILGGGAAGLAAARACTAAGKSVLLLEARPRLGGRIHTLHDPAALPLPIELGAEFVHGVPSETWSIFRAARLTVCELDTGDDFQRYKGQLRKVPDIFQVMGNALKPLAKARNGQSVADVLGPPRTPDQHLAYAYVEGFDAAPADDVSAMSIHQAEEDSEKIQGDRQFRVLSGYDRVIDHLRTACDPAHFTPLLSKPVTTVEWRRHHVTAQTATGERFTARQALITLPVPILRDPAAVRFSPDIPDHRAAANAIGVGPVVKTLLLFRTPFWEDIDGFKNLAFFYSRDPHVPTWWTFLPLRTTALTGWSGGPAATSLSGKPHDQILATAIDSLATISGWPKRRIRAELQAAHVADWQSDPWSRGAYSYLKPGHDQAPERLARPLGHTLFFAGEATHHTAQSGTVPGAIASGSRAAKELLRPA